MANEKRLIDANALKNHVQAVSTHWLNDWSTIGVLAAVDKAPTVDAVEVVHGKWEGSAFNMQGEYEEQCSHCKQWSTAYGSDYCPNCGAKMDGERKDNGSNI